MLGKGQEFLRRFEGLHAQAGGAQQPAQGEPDRLVVIDHVDHALLAVPRALGQRRLRPRTHLASWDYYRLSPSLFSLL
ncbi:hypothetical protein D3C85_1760390 [compost metagenome]